MSETTTAERPDPLEWSDGYWQLDQAILDATDAKRPVWQVAVLTQIRDEWERTREDAKLGAALRAALDIAEGGALIIDVNHGGGYDVEYALSGACAESTTNESCALAALLRSSPPDADR